MKKTAFCKINLTLEILGTDRGDGFHDLKTVMHKIPLGDIIELDINEGVPGEGISFCCDSDVCRPEDNLAYRAAKAFMDEYKKRTNKTKNIFIKLSKVTPTGAGLGGGSADAAAVLDMLSKSLGVLTEDDVLALAESLGSDVPFCLEQYVCAYCTGRGEVCRNIDRLPDGCSVVVAKPLQGINTAGIYAEYDKEYDADYSKNKSDLMEKALREKNLDRISENLSNDFEEICMKRLPEIQNVKDVFKESDARCSQMSGSGSAVFGIFDDKDKSINCFEKLKDRGFVEVYIFHDEDFQKMYKGE